MLLTRSQYVSRYVGEQLRAGADRLEVLESTLANLDYLGTRHALAEMVFRTLRENQKVSTEESVDMRRAALLARVHAASQRGFRFPLPVVALRSIGVPAGTIEEIMDDQMAQDFATHAAATAAHEELAATAV